MSCGFLVVDAQIHEPSVSGDWSDADPTTRHKALSESLLDYMDAVGVDSVVLHATQEREWALAVAAAHPTRVACVFGTQARFGATPAVAEEADVERLVEDARRSALQVGLRLILGVPRTGEELARYRAGAFDRLLGACERHGLPLFLMVTWNLSVASEIATRYPALPVIVDHLGIPQPPSQEVDAPPWKAIDEVLALARHPNIAIKLSGAPGLSSEPFPYADLWPHLLRYVDAFTPGRLMWGTDISRYDGRIGFHQRRYDPARRYRAAWPDANVPTEYPGKHSYAEALHYVLATDELSDDDKQAILGRTAQRLLGWPRARHDPGAPSGPVGARPAALC